MLDNSSRLGAWALALGLTVTTSACDPVPTPEIPDAEPAVRVPEPVPVADPGVSRNLLQAYVERDPDVADTKMLPDPNDPSKVTKVEISWEEESRTWKLPYQAKRLVAALVIAVAHDRLDSLRFILTPDAQWGWPDPRRPGARPVFDGDGGEAFFSALRKVGARLPETIKWTSLPVPPGIQVLHTTGAEPMWTFYSEGYDGLLLQLVVYGGNARIAYVGMYEELPSERPSITSYGPMPPLAPPRRPPPGGSVLGPKPPRAPSSRSRPRSTEPASGVAPSAVPPSVASGSVAPSAVPPSGAPVASPSASPSEPADGR